MYVCMCIYIYILSFSFCVYVFTYVLVLAIVGADSWVRKVVHAFLAPMVLQLELRHGKEQAQVSLISRHGAYRLT